MNYDRLLSGKTAVITSGAHGMGKYIAKVFARHGALCIINGKNPNGEETAVMLREVSPGSIFIRCDMSQRDDMECFIEKALLHAGRIDIVVNNVGINLNEFIEKIDDGPFEETQQVNLRGVIRTARGFIPSMITNGGGVFIHVSTVHSEAGILRNSAYASSKSAINSFSRGLAREFAHKGIRSNVISPGGFLTRNSDEIFEAIKDDNEQLMKHARSADEGQPAYGPGSAYDMGNTALFLASDMSRHITGATIMSDGGTMLQSQPIKYRKPPDTDDIWLKVMKNRFTSPFQ